MKIQIETWWGNSLYECEAEDLRGAVEKAVSDGARLDGARLVNARLDGASLVNARLDGARLDGARLDGASLVGARLVGARLVDGRTILEWIADPLAGLCDEPEAIRRAIEAWGAHTWRDCPMHAAHGWSHVNDAPESKRLLVACFVALFDSMLLPNPVKL